MPDDIRPGKLKTEAAAAEDRGDWAAASSLWQDFLAHPDAPDPLPPRAFLGLSRAEAELGRLDAAWDTVTRGLALHPGKAPLRERQAELASQRQDWAQAESCWQGCLADFPGRASHKWHHELARALQAQGKQQALLACLQKAVRKFPGAVQPRLMLARLYLDQGAWKDAAVYAERAVALSQEHGNREQTGQSTLLLARALLELGRSSEAWAQADAAKALFPASDQRFRNQYINLLCDTRETAQLKAEYSGGFLSSGHSAKDARAVFTLIQANEIAAAQAVYRDTFDARAEEGDFQRLLSHAGVAFQGAERAGWFRRIGDLAARQAETARGAQRSALLTARLHALYGLEETGAFGAAARELQQHSPAEAQKYLDLHARMTGAKRPERGAKIFGIGLSKTGTTSLARALEMLGFATADFVNPCSEELLRSRDIALFDALTDTPIAYQFEALYDRYPEARFIYTKRPLDSWETSFSNYFRHSLSLDAFSDLDGIINGLPQIKHGDLFRDIFNRLYVPYGTPREAYLAHEERVLSFFAERPQARFLQLDIFAGEGFPELARFLETEAPDAPFPRENVKSAGLRQSDPD